MLGFLHGCWGFELGPHACCPSGAPTEPLPALARLFIVEKALVCPGIPFMVFANFYEYSLVSVSLSLSPHPTPAPAGSPYVAWNSQYRRVGLQMCGSLLPLPLPRKRWRYRRGLPRTASFPFLNGALCLKGVFSQ